MIYLNDDEKKIVSEEIENLEKKSSVELVAVVSKKISNYKYQALALNIVVISIISLLLALTTINTFELIQVQVLTFFTIFIILEKFNTLVLDFLPRKYINNLANDYAKSQFYNLGLNKTQTKQTLMFFASLDEKYVEIIVDEKISSSIDDSFWKEIVDEFIDDVKRDQLSNGYLKAIQSCSDILIEKFPIQDKDINELPNDVVELKY